MFIYGLGKGKSIMIGKNDNAVESYAHEIDGKDYEDLEDNFEAANTSGKGGTKAPSNLNLTATNSSKTSTVIEGDLNKSSIINGTESSQNMTSNISNGTSISLNGTGSLNTTKGSLNGTESSPKNKTGGSMNLTETSLNGTDSSLNKTEFGSTGLNKTSNSNISNNSPASLTNNSGPANKQEGTKANATAGALKRNAGKKVAVGAGKIGIDHNLASRDREPKVP